MVSCRPFDDSAGGFSCAAFEILLSSLSSAQDPRRFDTDLDLQTVRGEFKNKCDSSNISVQRRLANKLDKI